MVGDSINVAFNCDCRQYILGNGGLGLRPDISNLITLDSSFITNNIASPFTNGLLIDKDNYKINYALIEVNNAFSNLIADSVTLKQSGQRLLSATYQPVHFSLIIKQFY